MSNRLLRLYEKALSSLYEEKHISDIFQLGLSFYDLDEDYGSYLYFASDVSQILKFYHVLWNPHEGIKDDFIKKYSELTNIYKDESKSNELKDLLIKAHQTTRINIDKVFEKLKAVKFKRPLVMSNFLEACLNDLNNIKSFKSESLFQNKVYDNKRGSSFEWSLGEFLENYVFLIRKRPHYLNVFFTENGNLSKIYSLSVFCDEDYSDQICRNLISSIAFFKEENISLLEDSEDIEEIRKKLFHNPTLLDIRKKQLLDKIEIALNGEITNKKNELLQKIQSKVLEIKNVEKINKSIQTLENNPAYPEHNLNSIIQCLNEE